MEPFTTWQLIWRLLLAGALGAALGAERETQGKAAGLRTNTLIALGSAVFTMLSIDMVQGGSGDPSRIAAQIVTGVGFLGGGAILRAGGQIHGLTTAATIWVNAAVGAAVGAGAFRMAIVATGTALAVLTVLKPLDRRLEGRAADAAPRRITTEES
jgi:putative Mg2+ transporter-C (MgtC) family protein